MRLEFEPNTTALPFVENEYVGENAASEAEKTFRDGVRAAQDGKRAEARNLLLRVTEMDTENENAWLWLASISEYPEELLVFLGNVLKINPDNERALEWQKATKSLLAKTLVQRGIDASNDNRNDFARQCFEQALGHDENNEMAWLWLAAIADSDEAKTACFEKVLSFNPFNETAKTSLKSMQNQKMENLLQEAVTSAVAGNRESAGEMLATVLEQNPEFEEAWVLKAHLANSFGERAECFVRILALNSENEMAKANVASWRALADKAAAQQPVAEEFSLSAEAENDEEFSVGSADEEPSAEFSNQPETESFVESETEQTSDDFSAEAETENQAAEFYEQQTVQFNVQDIPQEAFAEENSSSEDEFSAVDEQEDTQAESAEMQSSDEMPEDSSVAEEFENGEAQFEAVEAEGTTEENLEAQNDFAAETKDEEAEMNYAFTGSQESVETDNSSDDFTESEVNQESEDYSHAFSGETESSEAQAEAEENFSETNGEWVKRTSEESVNGEQDVDDWTDASHNPFANYSDDVPENSYEMQTESYSQGEIFGENQTAEDFAEVETSSAENDSPGVGETSGDESFVPETIGENDNSQQFAEVSEEVYSAEEFSEVPAVEEEKFQFTENFYQFKAEMLLCPFCNTENEKQAFACHSCWAILTLSDLEMLLGPQEANQEMLQQSVESLEREHESYGLNAEQLAFLGIGHINLKNYRHGFSHLQEAVRMNPSNVILSAQVNALAIRLAEMEEQQSVHDAMPKNRKILVVDDSATVRKLISGKLEKCGHEVVCAVDGLDALEKIKELMPDLILLDITMPRMDGYQVCKLIRSNEATKEVPVVMISGKDGFFDKVRGRMAGTTGYITKPFGPETLMKTVETYLN